KFEDFPPTTATAEPRSWGKNALVAGALVAGLGLVTGLGLMLVDSTSSKQEKPAVIVPNSNVGSVAPQPASAVAPPSVAPAPPAPATVPDAGQVSGGPANGGDAPLVTAPAQLPAPAPVVVAPPADPAPPAD